MKKLFTLLCLLTTTVAFAQFTAPGIQWQKCLGGTGGELCSSIQQTTDGGYITCGSAGSQNGDVTGTHGLYDYWVVKLDNTGTLQWQKALGGTNHEEAKAIRQTADGGYIVVGYSKSNDGDVTGSLIDGDADFWVVKMNDTGSIQWQKTFGGSSDEFAWAVEQTSDGGYVVAGFASSLDGDVVGGHGLYDCWIVKLDDTGALKWQKPLGGTENDGAYAIKQTSDGGYIISGLTGSVNGDVTSNHGSNDSWIVKLDSMGAIQWEKTFGGSGPEEGTAIQQTVDGGYIVAGSTRSNDGNVSGNHGINDCWIVKMNSTGTLQWQKTLGGSSSDYASAVQQTIDGGYIVGGTTQSTDGDVTGNHGVIDYWIVKLNNIGVMQWQRTLGGSRVDNLSTIQQTTAGEYIVAGSSESNNGNVSGNRGAYDFWIVKLSFSATNVSTPTPTEVFSLFPNPANAEVRLQTNETIRSVLVTDLSGKEVFRADAVDIIPTAALANGLYLVRVQTTSDTTTQKLLVQHL